MKPTELFFPKQVKINPSFRGYIDVPNGMNGSLNRLQDKDCVIAYFKIDVVIYLIMEDTHKNFKFYRVVQFDEGRYRNWSQIHGEELKLKNIPKIINKKWVVTNKEKFNDIKKRILVESLKEE